MTDKQRLAFLEKGAASAREIEAIATAQIARLEKQSGFARRVTLLKQARTVAGEIAAIVTPQIATLKKEMGLSAEDNLQKRDEGELEKFLPGIADFALVVDSLSKLSQPQLAEAAPTALPMIAGMKETVRKAAGKASNAAERDFVSKAENAIAVAEKMLTGAITTTGADDRAAAVDLVKLARSGGGVSGEAALFGCGAGVVSNTQKPDSNAVLKQFSDARKRPRILFSHEKGNA